MRTALLVALLMVPAAIHAGNLPIIPTTTLAAETSNNTSAANSFTSQTNGNLGATNVSKVDIHSLLYAGSNTKVIAHFMPWFGDKRHMDVGYNSHDPVQIHNQITDMISRGIDGVIIDWYGSADYTDVTAKLVMAEAEQHSGFTFAIMVDKGALDLSACKGCTPQQTLIQQVQYVEQTYIPSPAYMRINNRPMITNFDIDLHFTIDWDAVQKATSTNPDFIFQHASGFTHDISGGSYAWVSVTAGNYGLPYLDKFYRAGLLAPQEETFGGVYKGFNDTLASWGQDRIMGQQCGQTWLQTFSDLNGYYNSGTPLANLQLVTWNDYEEGTEIESGIDNCVAISASMAGGSLQWTVTGNENTIDHYVVYISTDGQNLMPLNTMPVGSRALDLSSYSLAGGTYTMFVQAVGKPTLKNQMSGAVGYSSGNGVTVSAPTGGQTDESPVHYVASATSSCTKGVSAIGIYTAPYQLAYVVNGSSLDTKLNLNAGSYNTVVQSWDNCGGSSSTAIPITVNPQSTVTVSAPVPNSNVGSPVHFAATATTSCSKGVSAMGIYTAPSMLAYSMKGAVLNTDLTLGPGTYNVVVEEWDNCGGAATTTVPITVTAAVKGTVTVSAPASNSIVGTPVHFVASATTNCAKGVSAMGIYTAPFVLAYTVSGAKLDTKLSLSAGTYNTVVQEWDNCGGSSSTAIPITVNSTGQNAVTVTTPANNSNVGSPVHFVATATSSCSKGVAAMGIYTAPSQLAYTVNGASLDTSLTLSPGTYNTVIHEWDYCGGGTSTTVTISVPAGEGGSEFSNLQAGAGWTGYALLPPGYGICNSCKPTGPEEIWNMTQDVKSPSISGASSKYDIAGQTKFADVLWNNHLIGDFSSQGLPDTNRTLVPTLHNFTYDVYFYGTNLESSQALEFDINQFFGDMGFIWGHECRIAGGHEWDTWDNVKKQWVPTGIACNPLSNAWNHLVIQVQRTTDDRLLFQSITLNGKTNNLNIYRSHGTAVGWYGVTVNWQIDGDKKQTPYSVYLDNFNFLYQ